jgi:hypothetical protein
VLEVLLSIFFLLQQTNTAKAITFDLAPDSDDDLPPLTAVSSSACSKPLVSENDSDDEIKPCQKRKKKNSIIDSDDDDEPVTEETASKRKKTRDNEEDGSSYASPVDEECSDFLDSDEGEDAVSCNQRSKLGLSRANLHLATLIKKKTPRNQLADKVGLTPGTTRVYKSRAKDAGLLTTDDVLYLNQIEEKKYYLGLCKLVKEKKPIDEIYSFCTERQVDWVTNIVDEQEKKLRLNRIFAKTYERVWLTPKDTEYLKMPKTVIGRNGDTKEKIFSFLEERSSGTPITGHIKTLEEEQRITPEITSFLELCKDQDQTRRSRQQKKTTLESIKASLNRR